MRAISALDLILVSELPNFLYKIYSKICATNSILIRNGPMQASTA
jgi:hypothetical protein